MTEATNEKNTLIVIHELLFMNEIRTSATSTNEYT